jgi:hypothetical protein
MELPKSTPASMAPLAFGLTSKQHSGACRRGAGGSNTLSRFQKRRHFCSHGGSITTKRDEKKQIFGKKKRSRGDRIKRSETVVSCRCYGGEEKVELGDGGGGGGSEEADGGAIPG